MTSANNPARQPASHYLRSKPSKTKVAGWHPVGTLSTLVFDFQHIFDDAVERLRNQ